MTDILEELKAIFKNPPAYTISDDSCRISLDILRKAISEIEWLRTKGNTNGNGK
jgi:hypothetical protein